MSFRRFTADSDHPEILHVRTGHQQWQQETAMLDMTWGTASNCALVCLAGCAQYYHTCCVITKVCKKRRGDWRSLCPDFRRLIASRPAPGVDTERVANSSDRKFSRKDSWQLSIALVLWDDVQPARAGCTSSTAIGRSSPCRGRWPRCGCCRADGNW